METRLQTQQIAEFALGVKAGAIGPGKTDQLKRHLLDSLGSLLHATRRPTIQKLVNHLSLLGKDGNCQVPLLGRLPVDRAAQLYTALIRYPDFMDNYMGKEATCHPSDNIGALLAIGQLVDTPGDEFLIAMAVAYEVECRLVEEIPVMKEGIDHTLFLAYSIVSGTARLMGLSAEQTAHALAIAGCAISPLATSRASYTYEWKGLASSLEALCTVNAVLLAQQDMTGPLALFEGPKGFKEIFSMDLKYDWSKEDFSLIPKCVLKRYNAEVHSQSAIDALLILRNRHDIKPKQIKNIELQTFLTAYHIVGSGAYGDRQVVDSKEQADHSMFYLLAVAMLDGDVQPAQFEPERIRRQDVQELLQKVTVKTGSPLHEPLAVAGALDPYTRAYPEKMKAKVTVTLQNGEELVEETEDHPGFHTRPFSWHQVIDKFNGLSRSVLSSEKQNKLVDMVQNLENYRVRELAKLLSIQ
jgi:2-methylcitrate dehydratase